MRHILGAAGLFFGLLGALPRTAVTQDVPATARVVVEGTVLDTLTGRPVRLAIVRVVGTDQSVLSDDRGRYRLSLLPGEWQLEVRRIGYQKAALPVVAGTSASRRDIYLRPFAVGLETITVTAPDDRARRIMAAAIAHKNDVLSKIHDYRYDAYVKFVVRDLGKHPDSTKSIVLLTESRTSAYWEHPDRYQEVITARRQSSNLDAERNLVSVGEIVNFSRNRIDLQKYSIVSPTADDALDHYDYRILDTLDVEGRRVFRLGLEPRSSATPGFVGMIDVADSTFEVRTIDVGVNDAVRFEPFRNLRYRQKLKDLGDQRWMPYEIRLTGEIHIGVPIPDFPEHMGFEHLAALDSFRFDQGDQPNSLGEFRIVVDDAADRADSTTWGTRAVPLSDVERTAWARIDSVERLPANLVDRLRQGLGGALWLSSNPDFFKFNRVDGAYVGAGWTWRLRPDFQVRTKLGYGFGDERWQYRFGGQWRLSERQRFWVGASMFDETTHRPALVSRTYNPTFRALLFRLDPLDYYRERGLSAVIGTKLLDFTRFDLFYYDARHTNLGVVTDYAVFNVDRVQRLNPPIVEGRLRSLSGVFTYDSRPLLKRKGRDYYLQNYTSTRITLGAEISAPGFIPSDYDYRRYTARIQRTQRTLNLGLTTMSATAGLATGPVPPQRYFTVDFGMEGLFFQEGGLNTLEQTNFSGNRAALFTVRHEFDRLFRKIGVPLLRNLPFTVSVHGGVFWTDFVNHQPQPGDGLLITAPRSYRELGFGIGNLTPFLSPFNFATYFTWQLSSYPTDNFVFKVGLTPP